MLHDLYLMAWWGCWSYHTGTKKGTGGSWGGGGGWTPEEKILPWTSNEEMKSIGNRYKRVVVVKGLEWDLKESRSFTEDKGR